MTERKKTIILVVRDVEGKPIGSAKLNDILGLRRDFFKTGKGEKIRSKLVK